MNAILPTSGTMQGKGGNKIHMYCRYSIICMYTCCCSTCTLVLVPHRLQRSRVALPCSVSSVPAWGFRCAAEAEDTGLWLRASETLKPPSETLRPLSPQWELFGSFGRPLEPVAAYWPCWGWGISFREASYQNADRECTHRLPRPVIWSAS